MNYAEDRLDRRARYSNEESTKTTLYADLEYSHQLLKSSNNDENAQGHELCGRTLRDAGLCRQATFHYAMAWCLNSDDEKAVGDYAQMVDLAGFPEVGIMCLLFFRLGGNASVDDDCSALSSNLCKNVLTVNFKDEYLYDEHCGCGFNKCGKKICFIPQSVHSSGKWKAILEAIGILDDSTWRCRNEVHAEVLIDIVTKVHQKKNPIAPPKLTTPDYFPPQLCFWISGSRLLSPLLQILLLKLLYASSLGSSFLLMACESIRHLSITLPIQVRSYAQSHKSHWAYYVFIYSVILGERMKNKRRGNVVPYHYPVWDIAHNLDNRYTVNYFDHFKNKTSLCISKILHALSLEHSFSNKDLRISLSPNALFVIGDSHVLSLAWQTIKIKTNECDIFRTIIPFPVTGLKAWHTKVGTRFFTHYNLRVCLSRLPETCRTVIISAGEIDCREGIGGTQLEGYKEDCNLAVENTVKEYLESLVTLSEEYDLQILIMPVPPIAHRSDKNGKSLGRGKRRQRMVVWNNLLRSFCHASTMTYERKRVFLLDYEESLRSPDKSSSVGFVLNKIYNSDYTHLNSAFIPLFEKALSNCNCDISLL